MVLMTGKRQWLLAALGLALGAGGAAWWLYGGYYNIAADDAHTRPVYWLLTTLRERSVARQAAAIAVPPLTDPALIRAGAGNYEAMCSGCHLAPGVQASELQRGLYPAPPRLDAPTRAQTPATDFWTIKHGIKASGMPAWGRSMDDASLWGLVAFLQQLPTLSPARYRQLVAESPGHAHGGGEAVGPAPKAAHAHAPGTSAHHHDHGKAHAH